ncbi:MAG: glycosyltransferase family 9 protein [Bacteriovoracales bacterium]|nr:glycosyltransferase family 9 protein [Bacteriovoracales bacterium]
MIQPNENKTSTIAITQLSCIEKVLQTTQACIELKKSHPYINLIFICMEEYSREIEFKLNEVFDQIFYINFDQMLIADQKITLSSVKNNLNQILLKINRFDIDVSINLDHSKSSTYFASLIKSRHKLGPTINKSNEILLNDRWSQFISSNTIGKSYSAFNLVDIFKGILGTSHNSYLKEHRKLKNKKVIIHPFSSQRKQKWPLGKWAEVIYKTLKSNPQISILVVGSKDNRIDANHLFKNSILKKFDDRLIDIVAKKNIEDIYDEFRDTSLFVGHNSLWGHLASLFNVQTLTIGLGTIQPYEITPYGHFNFTISPRIDCYPCLPDYKCDNLPCHNDISYNLINSVIDLLISKQSISFENLKNKVPLILLNKIDIYQTHIDKNHGMIFISCLHNEGTIIDTFRNFYRILWGLVIADQNISLPFPELSLKKSKILNHSCTGLNHIIELNKFGRTYSRYIIEETESEVPNIADIQKYSKKLPEIDRILLQLKGPYPHLAPLIDYYQIAKSNIQGITIKEMAESSFMTYHEALGASEALLELISTTLKNSKYANNDEKLPPQQKSIDN